MGDSGTDAGGSACVARRPLESMSETSYPSTAGSSQKMAHKDNVLAPSADEGSASVASGSACVAERPLESMSDGGSACAAGSLPRVVQTDVGLASGTDGNWARQSSEQTDDF